MDNSLLDSLPVSEAVQMIVDYAAGLSDSDFCLLLNSLTVSDVARFEESWRGAGGVA